MTDVLRPHKDHEMEPEGGRSDAICDGCVVEREPDVHALICQDPKCRRDHRLVSVMRVGPGQDN